MDNIEEKMVFALGPDENNPGVTYIMLGIPEQAWEYMKAGKTHAFDLTSVGAPIKLIIFGADTHDRAIQMLHAAAAARGQELIDQRSKDFNIKE